MKDLTGKLGELIFPDVEEKKSRRIVIQVIIGLSIAMLSMAGMLFYSHQEVGQRQKFQQGDMELKNAVTNISHDLRTPLTAIFGYLELLEGEPQTGEAARYLAVIRDRAEMLSALTEELFRYSVILSGESDGRTEAVALGAVLEESLAAFYTALREAGKLLHIGHSGTFLGTPAEYLASPYGRRFQEAAE